jgi:glycine/D-amino acid oxidase-like deaminating enzyme
MAINRRRFFSIAGLVPAVMSFAGFAAPRPVKPRSDPPLLRVSSGPDVVIVGAGVFGACAALRLRERGLAVVLVDAYGPGNSRSSSGGETRGLRIGFNNRETYFHWALRSADHWRTLEQESKRRLIVPTGSLEISARWTQAMDDTKRIYERLQVPFEVLKRDELRQRWPQIDTDDTDVALYEPGTATIKAREAVMTVVAAFQKKGGTLRIGQAQPGNMSGRRMENVVLASGERLPASQIVFACGPWLRKVFPELLGSRISTPRRDVIFFGTPAGDDRFDAPNLPVVLESRFFTFPSIEDRGLKIAINGASQQIDPDTVERLVPADVVSKAQNLLSSRFPGMKGQPVVETRVCQYENTADRNFLVDRHPDHDNVWIVGGGSGHGFKHGPMMGEYVADRIMGRPTDGALDQLFRLRE